MMTVFSFMHSFEASYYSKFSSLQLSVSSPKVTRCSPNDKTSNFPILNNLHRSFSDFLGAPECTMNSLSLSLPKSDCIFILDKHIQRFTEIKICPHYGANYGSME